MVTIKMTEESAKYVLQILDDAQSGYSNVHVPERIEKVRSVIEDINSKLK